MSDEEKSSQQVAPADTEPKEPQGLDVFDHVPEALALREFRSPGEAPATDAEGEAPEPSVGPEPVAEEEKVEEQEEPSAEDEEALEPTPEEAIPEVMPAWFDRAVQKIREEYEPRVKELRDIKAELGREKQDEIQQLRQEAESQQKASVERYGQACHDIGNQFVGVMKTLRDAEVDEQGQLTVLDENGTRRNVNVQAIGQFLMGAVGLGQGLFQDWISTTNRISSRVEQAIFHRRPELAKYKTDFSSKVANLGLDLTQVLSDPTRVEAIYTDLMNADKVANMSDAVKQAKEAGIAEAKRKKKAMGPSPSGGQGRKPAADDEEKAEKAASSSLGGLSPQRKESRAHIF